MCKIRTLVYPYDSNFAPILNRNSLLQTTEIIEVLSPGGWGVEGKNANFYIGNTDSNYVIKSNLEEIQYDNFDQVLLVNSDRYLVDQELINTVTAMADKKKDIIVIRAIKEDVQEQLIQICEERHVKLKLMQEWKPREKVTVIDTDLYDIHTPVITVSGIAENCSKLEVLLALHSQLEGMGYRVCSVSSRTDLYDMAIHPFPEFMISGKVTENHKIIAYNHYIHYLEQKEEPDVIILGIPGGIMPVTKHHTAYFGILSYEIYQGIHPDFTIMCLHSSECSEKYLEELRAMFKYKFNSDIDCFYMSNYFHDSLSLSNNLPIQYMLNTDSYIQEYTESVKKYCDRIYNRLSAERMTDYLLDVLEGYDDLQVM